MPDPLQTFFSVSALLGFLLGLVPLAWHLHAWNAGACYYMLWSAIGCANRFVNSVVWAGNARDAAPVWCDICERLLVSEVRQAHARRSDADYLGHGSWDSSGVRVHHAPSV